MTGRFSIVRNFRKISPRKWWYGEVRREISVSQGKECSGDRSLPDGENGVDKGPVSEGSLSDWGTEIRPVSLERRSDEECVRGGCGDKRGPDDTGFWEPCYIVWSLPWSNGKPARVLRGLCVHVCARRHMRADAYWTSLWLRWEKWIRRKPEWVQVNQSKGNCRPHERRWWLGLGGGSKDREGGQICKVFWRSWH